MHECMDATITLKDQASHATHRSRDGSSHPQYQSSILVDYGLHLINTQVPLILRMYENGSTVNQGFVVSHEHGVSVKNHPMGVYYSLNLTIMF
jgi:hypothetical protein